MKNQRIIKRKLTKPIMAFNYVKRVKTKNLLKERLKYYQSIFEVEFDIYIDFDYFKNQIVKDALSYIMLKKEEKQEFNILINLDNNPNGPYLMFTQELFNLSIHYPRLILNRFYNFENKQKEEEEYGMSFMEKKKNKLENSEFNRFDNKINGMKLYHLKDGIIFLCVTNYFKLFFCKNDTIFENYLQSNFYTYISAYFETEYQREEAEFHNIIEYSKYVCLIKPKICKMQFFYSSSTFNRYFQPYSFLQNRTYFESLIQLKNEIIKNCQVIDISFAELRDSSFQYNLTSYTEKLMGQLNPSIKAEIKSINESQVVQMYHDRILDFSSFSEELGKKMVFLNYQYTIDPECPLFSNQLIDELTAQVRSVKNKTYQVTIAGIELCQEEIVITGANYKTTTHENYRYDKIARISNKPVIYIKKSYEFITLCQSLYSPLFKIRKLKPILFNIFNFVSDINMTVERKETKFHVTDFDQNEIDLYELPNFLI